MDDFITEILDTIVADIGTAVENETPIPDIHRRDLNVPDIQKRTRKSPQIFVSLSELRENATQPSPVRRQAWDLIILVEIIEPENIGTSKLFPLVHKALLSDPRRSENAHNTEIVEVVRGPVEESGKHFLTGITVQVIFFADKKTLFKSEQVGSR